MSKTTLAPLHTWLIEPMPSEVTAVIERIRRASDVRHVAVMPDVHLAGDVTVGTVIATDRLLYPQAVGGDIGCGMLAVAFDGEAGRITEPAIAGKLLAELAAAVPTLHRHRTRTMPLPSTLASTQLSHPALQATARSEGARQLGTLGGGNHFVEFQADHDERLWLMIHTGSRAMGRAVRDHHLARACLVGGGLRALDAGEENGAAYANDVAWARAYAHANRLAIAQCVACLAAKVGLNMDESTRITVDHNHVSREESGGVMRWIHRKGAMPAASGMAGVIPGSMGTDSFHVVGLGHEQSLLSSAHGAGRAMSRNAAQKRVTAREFHQQMKGIFYDYRKAEQLVEEAPTAYKDIGAVMRAQRDLVKITRSLRPVLNYKGS